MLPDTACNEFPPESRVSGRIDPSWQPPPRRRWSSRDPLVAKLLDAAREVRAVEIIYGGGRAPPDRRLILPAELRQERRGDPVYCLAWCAWREAVRHFRVDRIVHLTPFPEAAFTFPTCRALADLERPTQARPLTSAPPRLFLPKSNASRP